LIVLNAWTSGGVANAEQQLTGGLPEMHSFQCKLCDVSFTEAVTGEAALPERASAPHSEEYHARH
jgi:hypothetical protein